MREALRAAASQAAASPLATVVATVVQGAGKPGSEREAPRRVGEPMAEMVLRGARSHAALVDALALYAPEVEPRKPGVGEASLGRLAAGDNDQRR